jgi:hypothetical protein
MSDKYKEIQLELPIPEEVLKEEPKKEQEDRFVLFEDLFDLFDISL